MIYLDNAATTCTCIEACIDVDKYLIEDYFNPSSSTNKGRSVKNAVDEARKNVANLIGCNSDQIIFTSGGSEANSLAICGSFNYLNRKIPKDKNIEIITSKMEHDSVINSILNSGYYLQKNVRVESDGKINVDFMNSVIKDNTGMVSLMYINNEMGAVNPVKEIGRICNENNILFHTDCVQALGNAKINVRDIGCDLLSISSHKIHGPKGVGALFVKDKSKLSPIIYGGDQEFGLRGGTENVAGIIGFGAACKRLSLNIDNQINYGIRLKNEFYNRLKSIINEKRMGDIIHINGGEGILSLPGKILSLKVDGIDGETLMMMAETYGLIISTGAACRSHHSEPNKSLIAIGMSPEDARSSVRVSFSSTNSVSEVQKAALLLANSIEALT